MKVLSIVKWGVLAGVATGLFAGVPATAQDEMSGDEILVVTTEIEPYVLRNGEVPEGFYFEIWEHVAGELGLDYEVRWVESLEDLGDVAEAGGADVVVAPLSSGPDREERFDFTETVLASGPQFGVHSRLETPITLASALFSGDILVILGIAAVALLLLGHLVWLMERTDADSDFPRPYVKGMLAGVWWTAVTLTTVGYGDYAPKTGRGRIVGVLAMFCGLFFVGAFVSEVTTAMQASRAETVIQAPEDIDDEQVGALAGSSYSAFLADQGVRVREYDSQREVFEAAERGDVDVVIADPYVMRELGDEHGVRAPGDVLYDEFVSFGVPQGSELRDDINGTIVLLHAEGRIREIIDRWLG